jgi:hypothetical protein
MQAHCFSRWKRDMDIDLKKFKQMSRTDLVKLVDHLADEYRAVMTIDEYFDAQTGACAVIQKKGGGQDTRKLVQMNSGYSTETRAKAAEDIRTTFDWAKEHSYETKKHGELVEPGPFQKQSKKQKSAYTKAGDGSHIPYDPKMKIGPDGELAALEHHAEMKILRWAESNGYEVIALAPTRGCCPNCQHQLRKSLGGEEKFKSVVPTNRQTPEAFHQHLEKHLAEDASRRHSLGEISTPHAEPPAHAVPHAEPPPHAAGPVRGGGALKLPPALANFPAVAGKMASHLGNAATALDALTTAADVGKNLRAGHTEAAARKTLEFGGRTWGGIEGAAIGAEVGGAVGSIVPGAGTLIGAAAGGVIGGIIGPTVGEEMAAKLFDGLKNLGKHSPAPDSGQAAGAPVLQRYLYETTSTAVGKQLHALQRAHPSLSGEAALDRLKTHAADVFKPVSESGERLMRGHGYRSNAVVQALDDKTGGKNQSGLQRTDQTDDPLTSENVVGTVLGGNASTKKGQRGLEQNKRRGSPLDRERD